MDSVIVVFILGVLFGVSVSFLDNKIINNTKKVVRKTK